MINTQIRSHWRLAFKATGKAIQVTCSVALASLRARLYIIKGSERLMQKRMELERQILQAAEESINKV